MNIEKAIERREYLEKRRKELVDNLLCMEKGVRFSGQIAGRCVDGYAAGNIHHISFTKEEVFGFLQREVDRIDAELDKMKPVFDVANQALKSIFQE